MKINVKNPELKTLNELNVGGVFKITNQYFIRTSMGPYDNENEITCVNLETGNTKQIHPNTQVTPVNAELNIF